MIKNEVILLVYINGKFEKAASFKNIPNKEIKEFRKIIR